MSNLGQNASQPPTTLHSFIYPILSPIQHVIESEKKVENEKIETAAQLASTCKNEMSL